MFRSAMVSGISVCSTEPVYEHSQGTQNAKLFINATGHCSDQIEGLAGLTAHMRIIPFRDEQFELYSYPSGGQGSISRTKWKTHTQLYHRKDARPIPPTGRSFARGNSIARNSTVPSATGARRMTHLIFFVWMSR